MNTLSLTRLARIVTLHKFYTETHTNGEITQILPTWNGEITNIIDKHASRDMHTYAHARDRIV